MAIKILALDGLNDAKLCKLVSKLLEAIPGVDYANIDYLSQRLTLHLSGHDNTKTIAKVVVALKENMPNVTVRFADIANDTQTKKKTSNEPVTAKSSGAGDASRAVGSPTNVAKAISSMLKEDAEELNRKKEREREREAEESGKKKETVSEIDSLAELLPQSSQFIGQTAVEGAEGEAVPNEDLPEDLSEEYTWEVVETENPSETEEESEAETEETETAEETKAERVPFFDQVREYMSVDVFWQLCGMAGGLFALLIGVCFPLEHPISYVFTTIAFILLAIFALLADTGESRSVQVTSSVIMVLGCAALYFTGGSRPDACIALVFYHVGIISVYFIQRSFRKRLEGVIDIHPKTLVRMHNDKPEVIKFSDLMPTDEIVIERGQCIPFDGIVVHGEGQIDESFLRGSKELRAVSEGGQVECGTYNMGDTIRIVMVSLPESTPAGIVRKALLDDNPKGNKIVQQVKRFQVMAVLVQLFLSAGVLFLFLIGQEYEKCLAFLPIALILLSPTGVAAVSERIQIALFAKAVKNGILLTSSSRFDELMNIKTIAIGCSNILIDGTPVVDSIIPAPEQAIEDVARAAAYAEYGVEHPVAKAIVEYYTSTYNKPIVPSSISDCEVMVGGVRARTDYGLLLVGDERFMAAARVSVTQNEMGQLCLYVARYGECIGCIVMRERFNEGFAGIGSSLRMSGVEKVVLLTGRDKREANAIGKRGSFDKVSAEHTSESKREQILLLSKERGFAAHVAYAGLVEDAGLVLDFCPCIAMGSNAADDMLHAAKAVIPAASPKKLATLFKLAKFSRISGRIIAFVTLGLNIAALLLAAFGTLPFSVAAIFLLALNLLQVFYGYLHLSDI